MKRMQHQLLLGALVCGLAYVPKPAMAQAAPATVWVNGAPPAGATQKELYGNHLMYIGHRNGDGRVEVHKSQSDILVVQSGEADFLSGGEIQEPVTTAPDELQGSSIKGGTKVHVVPGSVIHVAPGVPHQFLMPAGTQFTYLIVKVNK